MSDQGSLRHQRIKRMLASGRLIRRSREGGAQQVHPQSILKPSSTLPQHTLCYCPQNPRNDTARLSDTDTGTGTGAKVSLRGRRRSVAGNWRVLGQLGVAGAVTGLVPRSFIQTTGVPPFRGPGQTRTGMKGQSRRSADCNPSALCLPAVRL